MKPSSYIEHYHRTANDGVIGSAVVVETGGTFIMEGGEVKGNINTYGAIVGVADGTFTMSGGWIGGESGDTRSAADKGAVHLSHDSSVFTMSGGRINGNNYNNQTAYKTFGGVNVERGIFTLTANGVVSSNHGSIGAGVFVNENGKFTMTGGSIYTNRGNLNNNYGTGVEIYYKTSGTNQFVKTGGSIAYDSTVGQRIAVRVFTKPGSDWVISKTRTSTADSTSVGNLNADNSTNWDATPNLNPNI
jgi:hypothetical protein